MNKIKSLFNFIVLFSIISSSILAENIEIKNFNEIKPYIQSNTLLILDIDDTLLVPVQTLGTDVWFLHRLKQLQKELNPMDALDQALAEWEAIRHLTKVKIVEEGSDKIIDELQNNQITIMGLTTQGLALSTRTPNQLKKLNIDLSKTAPSNQDQYFVNKKGILYHRGILFTSGTPKGEALLKFLDLIAFQPEHIVFVNDKLTHLMDVEKDVIAKGIDFIGLRYGHTDERVLNFNPKIAEIQWKYSNLGHLISDEEAKID